MGRVIAISGGTLSSTEALNRYAIRMTGKHEPNVLFVGTASEDAPVYIENFTKTYSSFGCKVSVLRLETVVYSEQELDELFDWADLIYVGGGDTHHMVRTWEKNGVDKRLKHVYQNDTAVLTGISAGAICWFEFGHSDSESLLRDGGMFAWVEGMLGIYHGGFCPHYDEPGRESFDEMLVERMAMVSPEQSSKANQPSTFVGYALENDMAYVENGGETYFIRCSENARGYAFYWERDMIRKMEITSDMIM